MTRRHFLTRVFAASLLSLAGRSLSAAVPERHRELWLHQVHTGEKLRVSYWEDGRLDEPAYARLCHLLRDFRENASVAMDLALLDLLYTLQTILAQQGTRRPLMVLSAYRTKATNDRLPGTACRSMHLYGKAIDLYVPGVRIDELAGIGHRLRRGGVGTYPSNGFVHFDTGRVRYWGGEPALVEVDGKLPAPPRAGTPDRSAAFDPRDARWQGLSRDELDIMILKWRRSRSLAGLRRAP